MYYDVIVYSDINKCEQLYKVLSMVDCKGLFNNPCYLKQAVERRDPYCIRHAYRICKDDDGVYRYHSYRDVGEVSKGVSLTDFIKMVKPERTVTL